MIIVKARKEALNFWFNWCPEIMTSTFTNEKTVSREIKRIPHPKKVKKGEEKLVLNYRLEEVCGYGKNK